MKILFIGNSHTYFNDMPYMFAELMRASGTEVEITMLTRGGQTIKGHIANEQTRFNILYGNYDYVILHLQSLFIIKNQIWHKCLNGNSE